MTRQTTPRTISIEGSSSVDVVRQAITSLPLSLQRVETDAAVTVYAGRPVTEGIDAARTAVLVDVDDAEFAAAVVAEGRVIGAWQWAGNPALAIAEEWAAAAEKYRLEARATWQGDAPARRILTDQLAAAERFVGPVDVLHVAHWDEHGYIVAGTAGRVRIALSAVVTTAGPDELEVILFTADGDVTAVLPPWCTAQPASVSRVTVAGREEAPTIWESGMRAALRDALSEAPAGEQLNVRAHAKRRSDVIATALSSADTRAMPSAGGAA